MNAQAQASDLKVFILHAKNEVDAVGELIQANPQLNGIKVYRIDRIRRTFWQRAANVSPKWKVTFTYQSGKLAESEQHPHS